MTSINDKRKERSESPEEQRPSKKGKQVVSEWDDEEEKIEKKTNTWEETPKATKQSRWDVTPVGGNVTPSGKRSRWDVTPVQGTSSSMETPVGNSGNETPSTGITVPKTPDQYQQMKYEQDIAERNRPLTDEELDSLFPPEGYIILEPPSGYVPPTPSRKLMATPSSDSSSSYYKMPDEMKKEEYGITLLPSGQEMPNIKPEDLKHFSKLLEEVDEDLLTKEEIKERKVMELILNIKNGQPQARKKAMKYITDHAREFGAEILFNQVLPLLMSPTLEDQERHLLVKVIDRILFKLDDLVRPYAHKILVVISPLLIDEDYYARIEGREIISNLAKAAGLATMIANLRPDIDHADEYVRNTTARSFSVVASALGIPAILPFLKAVCQSKKSWQARHTGIKIIQQISILMGVAVLPYLKSMVDIIADGLKDTEPKVRIMTALAIAALAEASTPYGIESFDSILKPLWIGIQKHKGKPLAAFLKAIGFIIPLMSSEHAAIYTRNVMDVLIREFSSQDPEMQKIVLKVVKQCVTTDGIESKFVKEKIIEPFFKSFWDRKMALDRRSARPLIETTVSLAENVGGSEIIKKIVKDLKNDSEPFRKMTIETIDKIIETLGTADIDKRLEYELIDGILHTFQELHSEENSKFVIRSFGSIINGFGVRVKQYLSSIVATIKWRLDHKSPVVRQQAADLIGMIAPVMKKCDDEKRLAHFGQILYEYLAEEYPDVLGSILFALGKVLESIGTENMTPPIKDLLPRLTPILKNRHEKVQENAITLIGQIANKAPEQVAAKEWMRICFDLLDVLKAHRKSIRQAAILTFGYIAKSIGPHDVLATLLNNLKVQERQNRVCTTIAIAIVSENCGVFTVLPALMNEYKVPELNVQTGVLKSLSFMFEHVGEMSKDYIYAVTPLLEDALMDRDLVHRQTACTVVKHLALGCYGLGCEDALIHLLNLVWPNIFETSPHVINAVMEAIEGLRVGLGSPIISLYTLQGLFHPARKVRNTYWKIFNNLYIGQADALVSCYPNVPDDKTNHYQRDELMMFL
eukprot:gene11348-4516_t